MTRQQIQQKSFQKCSYCGKPLPVDEHGVPTTSVYFINRWLCTDCKFDAKARSAEAKDM